MKLLLPTFFSSLLFAVSAQISVTSVDFASAGDIVFISSSNQNTLDFTTTGTNHTWDFSSLISSSQVARRFGQMSEVTGFPAFIYGSYAAVPYKASYFLPSTLPIEQLGTLLQIPLSDVRQFTKKTSSDLTILGLSLTVSGTAIPAKADTIETHYALPLDYGNTNSSRGYTNLNMNPYVTAQWIQHRGRTTTVDGWGSITTPYGTFQALRVKHVITENDSLNYNGIWFPLSLPVSTEYEWWTNGQKVPILKVTQSLVQGNPQITGVEFKNNEIVGLNEVTQIDVLVFPNPTNGYVKVSFDQVPEKVEIIDLHGKVVFSDNHPALLKDYDLQSLDAGMYVLNVINSGLSQRYSLVKQ